jgi:hypothetical protein
VVSHFFHGEIKDRFVGRIYVSVQVNISVEKLRKTHCADVVQRKKS